MDERALDDALFSGGDARSMKRPGAASQRPAEGGMGEFGEYGGGVYGSMNPDDSEGEGESEMEGESDNSDANLEFTHEGGGFDDSGSDDDCSDFLDDGEEDNEF